MRALFFVVDLILSLVVGAGCIRAWAYAIRLNMSTQPGPFVLALTDWLVLPLRRALPSSWRSSRWDVGSLLLVALLSLLYGLLLPVWGVMPGGWGVGGVLAGAHFALTTALRTVMLVVLAHAVLSWVQPASPVMGWLQRLVGPLLEPLRRRLPLLGGVDLSGLVLVVAIQVLLIALGG